MAIEVIWLKNGEKRYKARVWDPVLRRRVSKTFTRRKHAEQAEADMKMRVYLGEPLERRKDIMFAVLAAELLANCTASASTIKEYGRIDRQLDQLLGRKSMRALTIRDVERAVGQLGQRYAPTTVNKAVIRLRHICKRAVAYGYINSSPAEDITNKPKIRTLRQKEILSAEEIRKFLAAADTYWQPLFVLWLATGLRRAEIFGLDPSCIDQDNGRVHVRQQLSERGEIVPYTKNKRARVIDVDPDIIAIVADHMRGTSQAEGTPRVVFPSKTGHPVHFSDWMRDTFKPLVAKIGRPQMGTHDLRHTMASQALSQGANIKVLQEVLGHADASLTLATYSHLIPSDSRANAARMARLLLPGSESPLQCPSPVDEELETDAL